MALKKVALRKLEDGIPNQALREIKALQEIEDNQYVSIMTSCRGQRSEVSLILPPPPPVQVVKLKDVFPHGTGFVLVFDFMLSDLSEVIRNCERPLTPAQVKGYMMMLLKGVAFLHHNNIMHRVSFCHTLVFIIFMLCPLNRTECILGLFLETNVNIVNFFVLLCECLRLHTRCPTLEVLFL